MWTGEFQVATRVLDPLVDTSRPDERFKRGARTLVVQLWYPTLTEDGEGALYFPDPALVDVIKEGSSVPDRVEKWRHLRTRAIANAPPAEGTFPLILFSHGFGMARSYYTSWIEELVSNGFVVAAIDHPFAGLMSIDGRVIALEQHPEGPRGHTADMATDIQFLLPLMLEQAGVDATRVAALGHSIGGAAALEACKLDNRISGCANLDGAAFGSFADTGVGRPFLVIHQSPVFPDATPDGELARLGREIEQEWRNIIAKQTAPVHRLSVRGTGHFSFSDALFLRPELVAEGGGELEDPLLVLRGTTSVIVDYFEKTFSGQEDVVLTMPDFITPANLGAIPTP